MLIDCRRCEMYQTQHCDDCLVTALLHPEERPLEIGDDLDPPLQALSGAGLIPVLRFRPRREASADPEDPEAPPAAAG